MIEWEILLTPPDPFVRVISVEQGHLLLYFHPPPYPGLIRFTSPGPPPDPTPPWLPFLIVPPCKLLFSKPSFAWTWSDLFSGMEERSSIWNFLYSSLIPAICASWFSRTHAICSSSLLSQGLPHGSKSSLYRHWQLIKDGNLRLGYSLFKGFHTFRTSGRHESPALIPIGMYWAVYVLSKLNIFL